MHKIAKTFQALTYWPIYLTLKFFVHFKIEGQENLKGLGNKAIIFASNHASYVDGPICAASMPRKGFYPKRFFPIRFLAYEQFFKWWFPWSWYVWINGSIKVYRTGGALRVSLKEAIKALQNRAHLWIYPEGRRTKDGKMGLGKRGVVFLHYQTKAPVVPVAIIGTFGICSLKALLRKRRVKVIIGKPFFLKRDLSLEEATEKIMSQIAELLKS